MKVGSLKDAIAQFELSKADKAILSDLYTDQRYYPTIKKLLEGLRLEVQVRGFAMSNTMDQLQHHRGEDAAYKNVHAWLKNNSAEVLKLEKA